MVFMSELLLAALTGSNGRTVGASVGRDALHLCLFLAERDRLRLMDLRAARILVTRTRPASTSRLATR